MANRSLTSETLMTANVSELASWSTTPEPSDVLVTMLESRGCSWGSEVCPENPVKYWEEGHINVKELMVGGTSFDGMWTYAPKNMSFPGLPPNISA